MSKIVGLFCASAIIFIFSSCSVYYNLFYADPVKCFAKAQNIKPYDAIVVPGYPHTKGELNTVLKMRLKWGVYLYKNAYCKNIIFSGSAVHSPYVEAKIMAMYAASCGVPDSNIFIEDKAEHTTENIYYANKIAKQKGWNKIALATDPAQASFMKPFRRKFKIKMDLLPVLSDSSFNYNPGFGSIDEEKAFVQNFIPLKEREGMLKSLRGTRGHTVKKMMRRERRETRRLKNQ